MVRVRQRWHSVDGNMPHRCPVFRFIHDTLSALLPCGLNVLLVYRLLNLPLWLQQLIT